MDVLLGVNFIPFNLFPLLSVLVSSIKDENTPQPVVIVSLPIICQGTLGLSHWTIVLPLDDTFIGELAVRVIAEVEFLLIDILTVEGKYSEVASIAV